MLELDEPFPWSSDLSMVAPVFSEILVISSSSLSASSSSSSTVAPDPPTSAALFAPSVGARPWVATPEPSS